MSEVYTYFSWQGDCPVQILIRLSADCPVQILITHGCTATDQRQNKFSETGSGSSVCHTFFGSESKFIYRKIDYISERVLFIVKEEKVLHTKFHERLHVIAT